MASEAQGVAHVQLQDEEPELAGPAAAVEVAGSGSSPADTQEAVLERTVATAAPATGVRRLQGRTVNQSHYHAYQREHREKLKGMNKWQIQAWAAITSPQALLLSILLTVFEFVSTVYMTSEYRRHEDEGA